jgi:ATP-dependent RNA helicase RhlE
MMDMGFIRDIRKIVAALPEVRQTLLFSATMPDEIAHLAAEQLKDPIRVEVTPQASTVERIAQSLCFVDKSKKRELLRHFLADPNIKQALVFTRTKHGADRVTEDLAAHGVTSEAIHGNKAQNHRERTLRGFRAGTLRVLVATDIAARGLDIPGVSHVFNFDLPDEPESYVHRIGRTARAGRDGIAIAFCSGDELEQLRDIERITGQEIPLDATQPLHINLHRMPDRGRSAPRPQGGGQRRPQGGHQHQSRNQGAGNRSYEPRGPRPELQTGMGERRFDGPRPERPAGEPRPDGGQGRRDRPRHEGPREPRSDGYRGGNAPTGAGNRPSSPTSGGPRRPRRSNPGGGSGKRPGEGGVSGFFGAIKRKLGGN